MSFRAHIITITAALTADELLMAASEHKKNEIQKSALFLWAGRMLFIRRRLDSEPHEHNALAIIISLDEPFEIELENRTFSNLYSAIVLPRVFHRSIASNSELLILGLDSQSEEYKTLTLPESSACTPLKESVYRLLKREAAMFLESLSPEKAWRLSETILNTVGENSLRPQLHKFDQVMEQIAAKLMREVPEGILLGDLEQEFSISQDRIMRRFKKHTGLPIRRYLLWARILKSMSFLEKGYSLTDSAHEAGFSDYAHMSRTFKKNFGFNPSLFFGQSQALDLHFCEPPRPPTFDG